MDGLMNVDCIELYVSDLEAGIRYYTGGLGLRVLWRDDSSVGLGMEQGVAEVVLQTERKLTVDFRVESVETTLPRILEAGGTVLYGPFEIPIGQCALVRDPWGNEYVILDMTRGRYLTDPEGNVVGIRQEP